MYEEINEPQIKKSIYSKFVNYKIKNTEYDLEIEKIDKNYVIYLSKGIKCLLLLSKISCLYELKTRKYYKIDIKIENDNIYYVDKIDNRLIINDCFVYEGKKLNKNFIDRYKIFKNCKYFEINKFCDLSSLKYLTESSNSGDIIFISKN